MKAEPAPMSVADYCERLIDERITVNRDYQREDKIWSPYIRSYFIESILLEYPIPKLFLYVTYDLGTRQSKKEIVDGQQRSQALRMFYENRAIISNKVGTEELRGKKYRDLDDDMRRRFLSYSLPIDEFRNVSEDDIRESFARMNVHNVTLNSEELRNAKFSGEFKRFIIQTTKAFRNLLVERRILSRRDTIRMADYRLFAEIAVIMDLGFQTTKSDEIDAIYKKYDQEFPLEEEYGERIASAIRFWEEHRLYEYPELTTKHAFYCIIAAIMEFHEPGFITRHLDDHKRSEIDAIKNRGVSFASLNDDIFAHKQARDLDEDPDVHFPAFVSASTVKTNVGTEKFIRFAFMLAALSE